MIPSRSAVRSRRLGASLCIGIACSIFGCSPVSENQVPGGAARIAVLAPAGAEMLDSLELGSQTVAIGSRGPWPSRMANLPQVGRFDSPNLERIVELGITDLVTTKSAAAATAVARLRDRDIAVLELGTETLEGVFESIEMVGARFDRSKAAADLVSDLRSDLDRLGSCTQGRPRRNAVFVVGHDPMFVAGPGSHLDELIAYAGGENVFGDEGAAYRQVSMEAVLERLPEVIFEFESGERAAQRERWQRWGFLPAVRQDRLHAIPPEEIAVPGVNLPRMAALLADRIHPGAIVWTDANRWECAAP